MGWGGQSGHMQAGIFYRTDGYDTNTPSIAVYADLYVTSVGWGYSNDNQNLNYWGQLGSGNIGYVMSSPSGTSTQKYVGTISIGGQGQNYGGGPTYGVGVQVSGAYDGSAPTHTEYFNLPARPPNTPLPPTMGVDSVGVNSARVVVYGSPDHRGSTVDWYGAWVTSNNAAPGSGGTVVASAAGGTFTATGLNASTTYYAWSQAHNGVGYSGMAGPVVFATSGNPPSAPSTPTVGTITAVGASTTFVAPANGGSPITSYQIQYADDNLFTTGVQTYTMSQAGGGTHVYSDSGPGSVKFVRVRAINGVGTGGWSGTATFTTTQTAPSIPAPTENQVVSNGAAAGTILAPGLRTGRTLRVQWSQDNTFATGVQETTHSPATPTGNEQYAITHPSAYQGNGTWFMRARIENAVTGVNSAYSGTRTYTQSHAPAATAGTPTGGVYRVYEASVPFIFSASDPAPSDSLTAYQIVVERNDTGAVVTDTGKIASAFAAGDPKTVTVAISSTVKDMQLRWKVRVWDLADTVSSYSPYSIFYLVDLPAVTITAPPNAGTVNVGSPTVTWTFTATSGRTQSRADVKIVQNDTGAIVYENWTSDPSARSMTPFMTVLQNSKSYTVSVKVKDSQNLENTVTSTFTSSFDPPAILDYTVSSPDIDNLGYVLVDWSNAIADPSLVAWRVYRRELADPTWTLLEEFTDQSVTQYKDFLVCSYKTYLYNVTQVANRFGTNLESPIGLVLKSTVAPVRTNLLHNPANTAGGTAWGVNAGGILSASTGPALAPFATSARQTRLLAGAGRFSIRAAYAASTMYTLRIKFRASEAFSAVQIQLRPDVNSATGMAQFFNGTIPSGESEQTFTVTTTATAPTATSGLALITSSGAVGSTLDVVATLEAGPSSPNHFSGAVSPDLLNFTPAWTGTAAASTSTLTEVPYMAESRVLEIVLTTYWIAVPDVPDLGVNLPGVKDDQSTLQFESATYPIIGRGRHRDYGDRLGYTGSLTVTVRGQEGTSTLRLRVEKMREAQETYWLRTPFGKLFPVALGDIGWSPLAGVGAAEMGELTIPYEEVGL